MELLLKRDEKQLAFSTSYDLFAKLELTPEEAARLRKAETNNVYVWQPDLVSGMKEGSGSRLRSCFKILRAYKNKNLVQYMQCSWISLDRHGHHARARSYADLVAQGGLVNWHFIEHVSH
jgi:hypothetical protein